MVAVARLGSKNNPRERVIRGKFGYMSPEQALGYPVDQRSDLFSLGLILYELFQGQRLYKSRVLSELQQEHRCKRAQAPLLAPHIPVGLEYIVSQCLAYHPEERYQTARAVL